MFFVSIKTNTNKSICLQFANKKSYLDEDLDEVRKEWVGNVVKYFRREDIVFKLIFFV